MTHHNRHHPAPAPIDNGSQRYAIAPDGGLCLVETVAHYVPQDGERATELLQRVAGLHPDADELVVHKRDGEIRTVKVCIWHKRETDA